MRSLPRTPWRRYRVAGQSVSTTLPRQHLLCLPWRHACRKWERRHPVGDGVPCLRVSMQALTNETRPA